ncbi:hypothetical protein TPHV1_430002 [Treponema phagedenis]|uniref:Uncharacterized protein n=1 Tax=Treponema phagedenis TaxID=162 RepID=A0A0B7GW47_TREPH|nr:hypothetical protein C5O78_10875 [Treponema phagedenis]CEM62728.1 hypothetical protein TPHV1_430002 [Treponema phagedenis]
MECLQKKRQRKHAMLFADAARNIADKFSEIGNVISSTFSQIADAAQGFINGHLLKPYFLVYLFIILVAFL